MITSLLLISSVDSYFFLFIYCREIDEEALQQALSAAVTCTILAAAGPQRSRVLATLYKVNSYLVYMSVGMLFLSQYGYNL